MAEVRSPALNAWVQGYVKRASEDTVIDSFVAHVDEVITKQIPEIAKDPMLVGDLHRSTRAQWRAFAANLEQDHRLVLPSQAADLARSLARRGMDLGILLKVYRVANQSVFQFLNEFIDDVSDEEPARDEVLVFIWGRAGQWMDDSVESLIETFYEERQRLHDGAVARRTDTIEALLGDAPPSADEAARSLGHALHQWQTASVVWAPDADSFTSEALLDAANAAAQLLDAPPPVTMVAGSRDLWCWMATPRSPDLAALAALEPMLREAGLRMTLGLPRPGVQGFRTSHAEARAAQSLALSAVPTTGLILYDDVELLCLVAGQDELMRRMVAREIGQLAGADKNLGLVRQTALAYLKCMNVEATAEQLFVHKNTVRYRIARAEELLGHPLSERSTQLELALRWVELFGPPVVD
jgi:DNA-binding PucR family transcriptional regulator